MDPAIIQQSFGAAAEVAPEDVEVETSDEGGDIYHYDCLIGDRLCGCVIVVGAAIRALYVASTSEQPGKWLSP